MQLKELHKLQDSLEWPESIDALPIVSWETCMSDINGYLGLML